MAMARRLDGTYAYTVSTGGVPDNCKEKGSNINGRKEVEIKSAMSS